jgi:hypothetical protein
MYYLSYKDTETIFIVFLIKNKIYDRFKEGFSLAIDFDKISFSHYLSENIQSIDLLKLLILYAFDWQQENKHYKDYICWSKYNCKWEQIVKANFKRSCTDIDKYCFNL